ncbi:MAG: MBOAT family O-acyltransferase [Arcanobacterium sp.]
MLFYWAGAGSNLSVIVLLITVTYLTSYIMRAKQSKMAFVFGLIINVVVLVKYKYPALVLSMIGATGITPDVIFPLGMSFIVFHSISYLVDSYQSMVGAVAKPATANARKDNELAEFINLSLYIVFFPKILQGPIVRYQEMREQIISRVSTWEDVYAGLQRFIIGLAKKVIIADEFGRMVASLPRLENMDAGTAWFGVFAFGFQLYFDFSAYSDMALGIARIFGFRFGENFNFPYIATSISEFWRRWHISLGAWFRNYIYIPLGGNRQGSVYLNLFIVFVLTGLWHGNTPIYLYWGIAHGIVILIERTPAYRKLDWTRLPMRILGWAYTMTVVFIGWLCFWQPNVDEFMDYCYKLLGIGVSDVSFTWLYYYDLKNTVFLLGAAAGIGLFSRPVLQTKTRSAMAIAQAKPAYQLLVLVTMAGLFILSFSGMVSNSYTPFLYFQF